MDAISLLPVDRARSSRYPVRLAVAVGESADSAQPWGIAADVSNGGLFVRTQSTRPLGEEVRLWFVDGRELRPVDARVVRSDSDGVGVSFEDESFYRWAFERMNGYLRG